MSFKVDVSFEANVLVSIMIIVSVIYECSGFW